MQTCFVNGCGSDLGSNNTVSLQHLLFYEHEEDSNGGATSYRLPLAAFFHAENEARLLTWAAFRLEIIIINYLMGVLHKNSNDDGEKNKNIAKILKIQIVQTMTPIATYTYVKKKTFQ